MAKLKEAKTITVVYEFTDTEELKKKSDEIRKLFFEKEGAPIRITSSNPVDKAMIVRLLSFAIEIENLDFAREVNEREDISDLIDVMEKAKDYSYRNRVPLLDAYNTVGAE
jgi:hypothetical protein